MIARATVVRSALGRVAVALLLATACAWVFAARVFTGIEGVRIKVAGLPASPRDGAVIVRVATQQTRSLPSPFAVIARIGNRSGRAQSFSIVVDGIPICGVSIGGASAGRVNCAQAAPHVHPYAESHDVKITSAASDWSLDYLELASYYGRSSGVLTAYVLPASSNRYGLPGRRWTLAVWAVLLISLPVLLRQSRSSPPIETALFCALIAATTLLFAVLLAAPALSPYRILISPGTFAGWIAAIAAMRAWTLWGRDGCTRLRAAAATRPDAASWHHLPIVRSAAIGALVGVVFASHAGDIVERHDRNISSLLQLSRTFFDSNPLVRDRQEVRDRLLLSDAGYDGQYFYNMTYDPFLRAFPGDPRRYRELVDMPPYRYGRIGFSVLTKILSAGHPFWYPAAMVTLVLAGLAACAACLSAFAQRHGASAWCGALVLLIPGFWHSVDATLPEPIAAALLLAGLLCVLRESWWPAGILFGLSMLVRETGGPLIVAVGVGTFVAGRRRAGVLLLAVGLVPLLLWRLYVGWTFMPAFGWQAFTFRPDNFGVPLGGIRDLWGVIAAGRYGDGNPEMTRAALVFPWLVGCAVALAVAAAVRRPSAIAVAGLVYAAMTVSLNYHAVWLHVGNAERLTIDLLLTLALLRASMPRESRALSWTMTSFWCAMALYMCFGTYNSTETLRAIFPWW